MGLFSKKICDVCGDKIGLLGNRKLEDGNLCKNCAAKLSPWFDDRRHTSLADIKEQLSYREENKRAVAAFHMSRSFGKSYDILMVDEAARTFAVGAKADLTNGNPDIIDCVKITRVNCDTKENRTELKAKDKDGKMVSYNPPRYEYAYDFYCEIYVDHPYIDQIRFKLNSDEVKMSVKRGLSAKSFAKSLFDSGDDEYQKYVTMQSEISKVLMSLSKPGSVSDSGDVSNSGNVSDSGDVSTSDNVSNPGNVSGEVDVPLSWQRRLLYHYTNSMGLDVDMSYVLEGQLHYKIADAKFYEYQVVRGNANIQSALLADPQIVALKEKNIPVVIPWNVQTIIMKYLTSLEGTGLEPQAVVSHTQELSDYVMDNSGEMCKTLGIEVTGFQVTRFELDQKSQTLLAQFQSMVNQANMPQANVQAVIAQAQSNEWTCQSCGSRNHGGKFCTECGAPRG